jgi:hypothetical protein
MVELCLHKFGSLYSQVEFPYIGIVPYFKESDYKYWETCWDFLFKKYGPPGDKGGWIYVASFSEEDDTAHMRAMYVFRTESMRNIFILTHG